MAGQMLSRKCIFFSFSEIKHLHIVNRNLNSRRVIPADANHILTARLYSPPVTCKPFKSSFDVNDGNLRVPFQFNFFGFFFFFVKIPVLCVVHSFNLSFLSLVNKSVLRFFCHYKLLASSSAHCQSTDFCYHQYRQVITCNY